MSHIQSWNLQRLLSVLAADRVCNHHWPYSALPQQLQDASQPPLVFPPTTKGLRGKVGVVEFVRLGLLNISSSFPTLTIVLWLSNPKLLNPK